MAEFYGVNAYFLEQYIAFKRSMGYAFKDIYTFKMFDRFTIENGATTVGLTRGLADKWAEKRLNESEVNRYKRVNDITNFSVYLNHLGYQSYICRQVKSYQTTFTPYIFSHEELNSFFTACDAVEIHRESTMKYVLPVVFRMIYGCGLRINEALSLKCSDVNLDEDYIIIREPKNGRDRMLPLSKSLTDVCNKYWARCLLTHNPGDYFFKQKNGKRYASDTVYKLFRKILWDAGISHGGKGMGPRVHDLRHSFSVHSLESMSRNGLDLYYSLPILSKYLGHQSLEATDKYVRLTAEMYPELMQDVDNLCSYVFPEVKIQ
jgi:integrase